ncbi:MAG TPA: glycosyltransferase N-terminal domain-containing protein [Gemmatimonadaceae bacterium]|nr:glycosyltransferase N-terminal domain-containing protein [Gemmatimonadaceae bacterium]
MHPVVRVPYSLAGHLARAAAALSPGGSGKFLASVRARRGIRERYAAWAARERNLARPLLWVHGSSVGEGLQAQPVIARLRERRPDLQVAYTFYSPSAKTFAHGLGADFTDYLAFDTAGDADAALTSLRPAALVFSKLDVWPVLVARAAARGVPVGLISATFSAESGRASPLAALVLADAYRALTAVGAVDSLDADRLASLGVPRERVTVTGDSRYDQVWARAIAVDRAGALLAPFAATRSRPTLVAGSTWPSDLKPLLEAWKDVRPCIPGARLIVAPHEPTGAHLAAIELWAERAGFSLARLGRPAQREADVVLVDRTGVLADLYALADIAYVGGGFHSAGLHSVVEPAAFAVPVLVGPRFSSSRDAEALLHRGGAFTARSAAEIAVRTLALFSEPGARAAAGRRAQEVVEAGLGAADRSVALVEGLLAR